MYLAGNYCDSNKSFASPGGYKFTSEGGGRLDLKYRQDQLFVGVWSRH